MNLLSSWGYFYGFKRLLLYIEHRSFVLLTSKNEDLSVTYGSDAEVNATKNLYTFKVNSLPLNGVSTDDTSCI